MIDKTAAIVTINDASKMTPEGRKEVAKWLRRQGRWLEEYGDQMSHRCIARYVYQVDEKETA